MFPIVRTHRIGQYVETITLTAKRVDENGRTNYVGTQECGAYTGRVEVAAEVVSEWLDGGRATAQA